MIGIKIDVRGLDEVQREMRRISDEIGRGQVLSAALNRTAEKARAELNRAIPAEFNVKASEVRNAVEIGRANRGRLEARLTIFGSSSKRGRSMNLIHFLAAYQAAGQAIKTRGAKVSKSQLAGLQRQLGFLIKRGGGLKRIEGAFIGNKGRTVFRRVGKARLPIEPVQVIGFAQMFRTGRIERRVMDKLRADLPVEVRRAVDMILAKRGA